MTDADQMQYMIDTRDEYLPLLRQLRDQCVGARREFNECLKNTQVCRATVP